MLLQSTTRFAMKSIAKIKINAANNIKPNHRHLAVLFLHNKLMSPSFLSSKIAKY